VKGQITNITKTCLFTILVLVLVPIFSVCNQEVSFMISYFKFEGFSRIGIFFFLSCAYALAVFTIHKILTYKLLKMTIHKKYGRWFIYLLFLMITLFFLYDAYKERNLEKTRDFIGIVIYLFFSYLAGFAIYEAFHMTDEAYKKLTNQKL
jgi:hypothetical protein